MKKKLLLILGVLFSISFVLATSVGTSEMTKGRVVYTPPVFINYSVIATNTSNYWGSHFYTDYGLLVPYTGADKNVDLGLFNLTTTGTGTFGDLKIYKASSDVWGVVKTDLVGGDAGIKFLNDANTWTIGVEGLTADSFVIADYSGFGMNRRLIIDINGRVGINELNPSALLDVSAVEETTNDGIRVTGESFTTGSTLYVLSTSESLAGRSTVDIIQHGAAASSAVALRVQQDSTADIIKVFDGVSEVFTINDGGNVDIDGDLTTTGRGIFGSLEATDLDDKGVVFAVATGGLRTDATHLFYNDTTFILTVPDLIAGNIKVEKTGITAAVIVNRVDGKAGSLSAGSLASSFRFDDTGSFKISKQTAADLIGNTGGNIVDLAVMLNTGFFGIGVNPPLSNLHLKYAGDTRLTLETSHVSTGAGFDIMGTHASNTFNWRVTGNSIHYKIRDHTNSIDKLNIQQGAAGDIYFQNFRNMGIKTSEPTHELNVVGDVNITGTIINDAIYCESSELVDQTFAVAGVRYRLNISNVDEGNGITMEAGNNGTNISIDTSGVYHLVAQPQVKAGAGKAGDFHMWLEKYSSGSWNDISDSNIELKLSSLEEDVIVLATTLKLNQGEKLRLVASVSDNGILLHAQSPVGEPVIPSIIFTMYRVGS